MKKFLLLSSVILLLGCFVPSEKNPKTPAITAEELQLHVNYLASDELEGRFTGTKAEHLAGEYIKDDFETSGIKPLFGDTYFQDFPFVGGLNLTNNNDLSFKISGKISELKLEEDYIPFSFSGKNTIASDIVFAGYGISAPELSYDDYEGIDVKNKAVLILRYNPEGENPHSEFEKFSSFRYKAKTAKEKGASAVIFFNGFIPKVDEDKLASLKYDGASGFESLPVIQVKRDEIVKLFKAEGLNLSGIQEKINNDKKPDSFQLKKSKINLTAGVEQIIKSGRNVAGLLEGSDENLKNEFIVIGAHYDHLGYGETGSLYRGTETLIHNGADDNASGTSGILELAEKFASEKDRLKRSIIFIGFSGEEMGLLGSNYFVNNPPVDVKNIKTMFNLDMIGRMNENKLIVYGTGTSSGWKDILNEKNESVNFNITMNDEGYGPSDHSSFYGKEIPVLFFFTGTHSDYHRPSDDADKINTADMEKLLNLVYEIAFDVNTNEYAPVYINVPRKDTGRAMAFRVYVGTIPDYASQEDGLKITGVSEGSPAQKAGLQGGDLIVEFGGKKISNIYDYTYALGDFTPGDIIDVVIIRGTEKINLQVELGAR